MKILTLSQIRSAESRAVKKYGRTFEELMETAGKSAAKAIFDKYVIVDKKITVVCGNGNNGGDGLVVAAELEKMGADVNIVYPLGLPKTETAAHFLSGVNEIKKCQSVPADSDIIIDAIFGIGLSRKIEGTAAECIEQMNKTNALKIALDVPSGVYCDGDCSDVAFKADFTVTFIALKTCFFLPMSSSLCGEVAVCDLGINPEEYEYLTVPEPVFNKRDKNAHKGTFGTALIIAGSYGMCGAEILACEAALRSGAGIVKAIVCDKNYTALTSKLPEVVTVPVQTGESGTPIIYDKTLLSCISSSSALLIGCGLGRNPDTAKTVKRVLETAEIPIVIDADGINAVAADINIIKCAKAPLIFTPHPAEMARLMNTTSFDVEHNRIRYAKLFATEYNCVVVLKGANTIIALPNGSIYFNQNGNPGMATGGSGDVLSGIIVSNLAQGMSPEEAALCSVWVHGAAGDIAASKLGQAAMLPSDIIKELSGLLN